MLLVPVVRAADEAKPGIGYITLSESDPCLVQGHNTQFTNDFGPRMQIMLPKSVGAPLAEVVEVISDTELRLKKEFGGDSGKSTIRIREKLSELLAQGKPGLEFKRIPHIDQQEMYHHVYQCLTEGGCIGIFPEGSIPTSLTLLALLTVTQRRRKPRSCRSTASQSWRFSHGTRRDGQSPQPQGTDSAGRAVLFPPAPFPFQSGRGVRDRL